MASATFSQTRLFTLDDANRMLPLIRRILEDVVRVHHTLTERENRLARDQVARKLHREEVEAIEESIDEDRQELAGYINELSDLGVILKAIDLGAVSFPATYRGRLVFLSWKLGEPSVGYWHELDSGFIGRQSINDLLPEIAGFRFIPLS